MSPADASMHRLDSREKSHGNHTRRISLKLFGTIVAGMVLGVAANGQTMPIAADAFRPSGALVRAIQPAGEIDQGPKAGAYELQFWSAGGDGVRIAHSNPKGTFWNIGLRFGYVLTGEHGPGPLRGRFEYVADVIPLIEFRLPSQTAWGGGIVPVGMKWNFVTRHRIAPYAEVNGGGLVTNNDVPPGGSMFNFTASGSVGVHVLRGRSASVVPPPGQAPRTLSPVSLTP